jgi:predicted RecA/RadA family phage recombinase
MKNQLLECTDVLLLTVANTVVSGDPVQVGAVNGVAVTDYSADDGKATIRTEGTFTLSVKGVNDAGNSAVALGDRLYLTTGDTPKISKKASGKFFGVALAAVNAGATTSIEVATVPVVGSDINVGGAHIADVAAAGAVYSQAEVNAIQAKVNAIILALETAKIVASA